MLEITPTRETSRNERKQPTPYRRARGSDGCSMVGRWCFSSKCCTCKRIAQCLAAGNDGGRADDGNRRGDERQN